ncbi:hypothetical protein PRIPAC_78973 [Pristionchus pacificus]|nr:hypothetical protein PRIPAC_78973 [Pristionchus pacificus]
MVLRKAIRFASNNIMSVPIVIRSFVAKEFHTNSSDVQKIEKCAQLAWKYRDVPDKYRLEKIAPHHFNHLMDLCRGFFETESLTRATGSTIDNCRSAMEWLISYSIAANQAVTNQSWISYFKETNSPVAFRIVNPVYRDPSTAPFTVPEPPSVLSHQEKILFEPLDEIFNKVWEIYPEDNMIYKGVIVYIDPAHRSSGLFHCMIDYNLNFPEIAEATGANHLVILCTANKSKRWYHEEGYKIIHKMEDGRKVMNARGEMVDLPEGEFWLMATELRSTIPLDVYPFWKAFKKCPQGNY